MMSLAVIGCSHHHTPIALRERLSFSAEQTQAALQRWRELHPNVEAVLLSTCNRTELYVASESGFASNQVRALEFLLWTKGVPKESLAKVGQLEEHAGDNVATHLFSVASGLDSMVVGEVQILGQVKEAYRIATTCGTVGASLHPLFQAALRCAKRVDTETLLHQHRVSLPAIAVVDVATKRLGSLTECETLILGAGRMADETLRLLTRFGTRKITIVNRHRDKAAALAARHVDNNLDNTCIDDWSQRFARLAAADLVVCTTGALECVVTAEEYRQQVAPYRNQNRDGHNRGQKPLLILDLAVPRDIDPDIGTEPGVSLYSIDDLREACEANVASRNREVPQAQRIVQDETETWARDRNLRLVGDVVSQWRHQWSAIKEDEVQRLLDKLPRLDDTARCDVAHAFDRFLNKLLHPAMTTLRNEARGQVPQELLDSVSYLFNLDQP